MGFCGLGYYSARDQRKARARFTVSDSIEQFLGLISSGAAQMANIYCEIISPTPYQAPLGDLSRHYDFKLFRRCKNCDLFLLKILSVYCRKVILNDENPRIRPAIVINSLQFANDRYEHIQCISP
ncbi:hypothetical protein QCA50_008298 [Cerrena zonata]|uniref:Uncharacterized protein n=1 Tax=Cerrena zonata TaxID=2478898 RepID=A0AAW0GBR0_9APHY